MRAAVAVRGLGQMGLLTVALLLSGGQSAGAWGWLTTPAPHEADRTPETARPQDQADAQGGQDVSTVPLSTTGAEGMCLAAILAAEQRYGIPDHLLLALGLQEAGYRAPQGLTIWPWSVNAAGEGRRFQSRTEAEAFVRTRQSEGVASIDIGCLQINLRWHPDAFSSPEQGFDPHRNVDYAARFLLSLQAETGDWWAAAGRYHSRSEQPQEVYLASLRRNLQVAQARIAGFVALAEAAGGPLPSFTTALAPQKPTRVPVPYRTEGAIWGADLSGPEGARRSLYSARDLEPILPAFLPPET